MQFQFFHIPVFDPRTSADELNQFLKRHRVKDVHSEFVSDGRNSFWAVRICYLADDSLPAAVPGKGAIDYREVLNPSDFAVYAKLRALRKELAEKQGVPAFALFTNDHLATMVTSRISSADALKKIPGIGETKCQKYGPAFLAILTEAFGQPESGNSDGKAAGGETQQDQT